MILYGSRSSVGNVHTGHISGTEQTDVNYDSTYQEIIIDNKCVDSYNSVTILKSHSDMYLWTVLSCFVKYTCLFLKHNFPYISRRGFFFFWS